MQYDCLYSVKYQVIGIVYKQRDADLYILR